MNKLSHRISVLIAGIALFTPMLAHAAAGAYVGVSAGQATLKQQGSPDETAVGYKLFGGLHATGPFSVEVSHVNLGKYFEDTPSAREISGNALQLVGKLPFTSRLTGLAKLGLFSWDVQFNGSTASTTGTDTTYGFGVNYILLSGQTLRFEWENYTDVGKVNNYSGYDMTLVSVGISISF